MYHFIFALVRGYVSKKKFKGDYIILKSLKTTGLRSHAECCKFPYLSAKPKLFDKTVQAFNASPGIVLFRESDPELTAQVVNFPVPDSFQTLIHKYANVYIH